MDSIKVIKDKCAQYWNEPGIQDAEIHSVLEFIYHKSNESLKEIATLRAKLAKAEKDNAKLREALTWIVHLHHGVSKGGEEFEPVSDQEWKECLNQAQDLVNEDRAAIDDAKEVE